MMHYIMARGQNNNPENHLALLFGGLVKGPSDALYAGSRENTAAGICGLPFKAPVMGELVTRYPFARFLDDLFGRDLNLLMTVATDTENPARIRYFTGKDNIVTEIAPDPAIAGIVDEVIRSVPRWPGFIDTDGSQIMDLKTPLPGPHFSVNMLLGNRIGFDHPLQTTPKSVVDRLGRGSFRSHAAVQVLATRWDMRQEENGFPCNRQFYLTENGKQIFYSADPEDPNVAAGVCRHARNHSEISYKTFCRLDIRRTIFLLPHENGLPLATEVQQIVLTNTGTEPRKLRLVLTGMFGPSKPPALQEDVLYSTIIMEGGILKTGDGRILAVSPNYWPLQDRDDRRFHSMIIRDSGGNRYPEEYGLDYTGFIGRGTLERPAGLSRLANKPNRKGPGFFALAGEVSIAPGESAVFDNFTGLVSRKGNPGYDEKSLEREVSRLAERFARPEAVTGILEEVRKFQRDYASFLNIDNSDRDFSVHVSENLPFQVLYQTFVSRSFDQTQKGYREIGFREIQDIFASLYYLNAQGESALARRLILEWTAQVYEFGYANHNFFWTGKEGGKWSDDALWLHQAVGRYANLTGDLSILDEPVITADNPGPDGTKKHRPLFETLKAALRYSTEISIGPHGLPLLDLADWNDCLKLDQNYHSGPEKERIWRETGSFSSQGTESVMNGFLAVTAARELASLARQKKDEVTLLWCGGIVESLSGKLRNHAWIGRNYARLLFNQYPGFTHAGAENDGLDTDGSGGTFFLNSFSWSVLSGVADETQIAEMLALIRKKLKTPFGLKLVSPMDLGRVVPTAATSEYFPGDRENGAVFKHAAMMAVAAFFDAAKTVRNPDLARELAAEAWEMIDLACPVRCMADPYVLAGNPRFCTQYNNSETGENVGPLLSGTATWMILSLMKGYGIEFTSGGLRIDPVLKTTDRSVRLSIRTGSKEIRISYKKPEGFHRAADGRFLLKANGQKQDHNQINLDEFGKTVEITGEFNPD